MLLRKPLLVSSTSLDNQDDELTFYVYVRNEILCQRQEDFEPDEDLDVMWLKVKTIKKLNFCAFGT